MLNSHEFDMTADTRHTDKIQDMTSGQVHPTLSQTTTPYGSFMHRTKRSYNQRITGIAIAQLEPPCSPSRAKQKKLGSAELSPYSRAS